MAEEVEDPSAPRLIRDPMDFELKHAAIGNFHLSRSDLLQDGEHGSGFQLDAGLGLIVEWTIQTAGVEVDEHQGSEARGSCG